MLKTIHRKARQGADLLETLTKYPLILIGGMMILIVLMGTFFRYILNNPLLWTDELARYLMIWMALIAASISIKRREHVGIKLIINRLPPLLQKIVTFITQIFMAYFLYILTREGYMAALRARTQISPALKITMFWPLLSVPLAGFFCLIQLILQMIIDLTRRGEEY